jgi:hypothetical protein
VSSGFGEISQHSAVLVALLAACGTPPPSWLQDAGPCMEYMPPANLDLLSPTVSFARDVMPVFTSNCSSASCHGAKSGSQGGLFLGAESAHGGDAAAVYAGLQTDSAELKSMPFVSAGDQKQSYLMHKIDGDQCVYAAMCVGHDCKANMPYASPLMSVDERDTLRRWIAQGAKSN